MEKDGPTNILLCISSTPYPPPLPTMGKDGISPFPAKSRNGSTQIFLWHRAHCPRPSKLEMTFNNCSLVAKKQKAKKRKGLMQVSLGVFSHGGGGGKLMQSKMLASFSMHPNVAKELELSWEYCWWLRASAGEIVDSFIWDFVKTFDVQHDPIPRGGRGSRGYHTVLKVLKSGQLMANQIWEFCYGFY